MSWLLRLLLALVAFRLVARTVGQRRSEPRPFDPELARTREKRRNPDRFRTETIDDAEYEDLGEGR